MTTTSGGDGESDHASHNIRVFAQVEGLDKQAIATQGDVSTGFSTREDACASGCLAACERATSSARADDALENCRVACSDACTKPDASGKFSCVVYPDAEFQSSEEAERPPGGTEETDDASAGGGDEDDGRGGGDVESPTRMVRTGRGGRTGAVSSMEVRTPPPTDTRGG